MLENHLKQYFGFNTFKQGQKGVIQRIINKESAAAIFPTGAGKSLCYQLPAMLLPGMTLVISPLLSLMKDQLDFLLEHNIPAARLDSTLSREEYNQIILKAKVGELKILMISVERFRNERFRIHLANMAISLLVIDEAHCISEWGHNFRPGYLKIPWYRKKFKIPQVLLLTATATRKVIRDMCEKLGVPPVNVTITGFYRDNIFIQVSPTPGREKDRQLLTRINENRQAATIVYVTLQKTAARVAAMLAGNGVKALAYHAGMKKDEREVVQNCFMQGEINCVVATIAFGMGIDKKDIRRVIHYDLPKSIESYSQEIGRSGRDGKPSYCEVLASRDNINVLKNFIYGDTPDEQGILALLNIIQQHNKWEVKITTLSYELDIRVLPLKTLLVYLEIEGIIEPLYTYFEEFVFKYVDNPDQIINRFKGERKEFVTAILAHCRTRKIWTAVDIGSILDTYQADRKRVVTALEYFDQKGWIELQSRGAVDVYHIKTRDFNPNNLTGKLYTLFKEKENFDINRIDQMVAFFESSACLSFRLAAYFGEIISSPGCGHCSYCRTRGVIIEKDVCLPPLDTFNLADLAADLQKIAGKPLAGVTLAKFFCGIKTPQFIRLRAGRLPHFGILENYPFSEVKAWVTLWNTTLKT